jgi:hypothetical protein
MSTGIVVARRGRQSLEAWIHEALADGDKIDHEGKPAKCSMFSLVHRVGVQELEIHSSRLEGREVNAKDMAEMFRAKAESYAQDLPGVQTFNLLAFYCKTEPEARHPFLVNPQADQHGGLASEPATAEGQRQQSMRHAEMLIQQVYRRQAVMDETAIRREELLMRHIEKLQKENFDAFDIVKEMMMEKALSEHNRKMDLLKFERATMERRKWMTLAPPLVNTLLGREVFPQGSVDTALIESVADSLSEEDIMKLAGTLKPEVVAPLMDRWKRIMDERAATKKLIAQSVPTSQDGEVDAGGGREIQ